MRVDATSERKVLLAEAFADGVRLMREDSLRAPNLRD
jgi:hypothetical protein